MSDWATGDLHTVYFANSTSLTDHLRSRANWEKCEGWSNPQSPELCFSLLGPSSLPRAACPSLASAQLPRGTKVHSLTMEVSSELNSSHQASSDIWSDGIYVNLREPIFPHPTRYFEGTGSMTHKRPWNYSPRLYIRTRSCC